MKSKVRRGKKMRRGLAWSGCVMLGVLCSLQAVAAQHGQLERGNPAARLLPDEHASEHWNLTARFESGHMLVAEFIITNIGIGERNAAATGYIITPDGKQRRFRNGRLNGDWRLSPDRLQIEVGKSRLDLRGPPYQLRVDKRSAQLDIQIRPNGPPSWSDAFSASGYEIDLLDASATAEGSLWIKGMPEQIAVRGTVALTHSWVTEAVADQIVRRVEFFSLQPDCALYAVNLTSPEGEQTQWVAAKEEGRTTDWTEHVSFAQPSFTMTGKASGQGHKGYPVPGSLMLKTPQLAGQIRIATVFLHDDPLDELPSLFRIFISWILNMRPHRAWALSPFEMVCPTAEPSSAPGHNLLHTVATRGTGVTAVTFLNPLPRS